MILLMIVVKFKGMHASAGASVVEGHHIIRSHDQVQPLTAEERAARDMVRAEEALKQGILYMDSVVLKWTDMDCLKPGGWLTDKVMEFYTKFFDRGEDVTLGKSRKDLLKEAADMELKRG
jgi:hypothetical protein